MEHLQHFGLSQEPFANDPVLTFYFASRAHTEAERRVLRAVLQGKGLCVLMGEGGLGKTILIRHLLEELDDDSVECNLLVMVQRGADANWVLTRIAREVGVVNPGGDSSEVLRQVYERLVEISEEGRSAVVLIDEAQMLSSRDAMEALRGLLNLEHEDRHLLSLVLIGPPELAEVIALDAALADRIDVKVRLVQLDTEDTARYIAHRIRMAGGDSKIFKRDAVAVLCRCARGYPRLVNTLADNAIYEAFLAGRTRVEEDDVRHAARDLGLRDEVESEVEFAIGPGRDPVPAPATDFGVTQVMAGEPPPLEVEEPETVAPIREEPVRGRAPTAPPESPELGRTPAANEPALEAMGKLIDAGPEEDEFDRVFAGLTDEEPGG